MDKRAVLTFLGLGRSPFFIYEHSEDYIKRLAGLPVRLWVGASCIFKTGFSASRSIL